MFAAGSAASVGIGAVAIVMGLLTAKPTEAQTLRLRLNPTTLSFPDANPTTTPVIQGNRTIRVRVRVRNALPSDSWSVNALAGGELLSLTPPRHDPDREHGMDSGAGGWGLQLHVPGRYEQQCGATADADRPGKHGQQRR